MKTKLCEQCRENGIPIKYVRFCKDCKKERKILQKKKSSKKLYKNRKTKMRLLLKNMNEETIYKKIKEIIELNKHAIELTISFIE